MMGLWCVNGVKAVMDAAPRIKTFIDSRSFIVEWIGGSRDLERAGKRMWFEVVCMVDTVGGIGGKVDGRRRKDRGGRH